jgi:hypothetical protein
MLFAWHEFLHLPPDDASSPSGRSSHQVPVNAREARRQVEGVAGDQYPEDGVAAEEDARIAWTTRRVGRWS